MLDEGIPLITRNIIDNSEKSSISMMIIKCIVDDNVDVLLLEKRY